LELEVSIAEYSFALLPKASADISSGHVLSLFAQRSAIMSLMVKALEQAIAAIGTLPDADQEEIGRRLLSHVKKLRRLREEIEKGIRSLEAGEGKPLDIAEFLDEQHTRDGAS
jgi:hypothetical protein